MARKKRIAHRLCLIDVDVALRLDLSALRFSYSPRENWRQIFVDAWRLHRDYFYDKDMHGVDWNAMRAKYVILANGILTTPKLTTLFQLM